jgi:hypothetical protein
MVTTQGAAALRTLQHPFAGGAVSGAARLSYSRCIPATSGKDTTMTTRLPTTHRADLFDAAKRRAEELRGEARDRVFDAAADAARQALRSTFRFSASLTRHSRLRGQRGAGMG